MKKCWCQQRSQEMRHVIHIFFGSCATGFKEGAYWPPYPSSIREHPRKYPNWIGLKKVVLGNFAELTGERLCQNLLLKKLQASACKVIKEETLWNSAEFLRIPFLQSTLEQTAVSHPLNSRMIPKWNLPNIFIWCQIEFYLLQWKAFFNNDEKRFLYQVKSLFRSQFFFSRLIRPCTKVNFKIYDVTDWITNNYHTYIDQYLKK